MGKISDNSLRLALQHVVRHSDTDIFPPLPEIAFLRDYENDIVAHLSNFETGGYVARTAFNCLAPKGRLGFRNAHQLSITDTLLLLAAVIEVGGEIEKLRLPIDHMGAFSYRFDPSEPPEIFAKGHTYRDWLIAQAKFTSVNKDAKFVLITDISDFYQRIYAHRLEGFFGEIPDKKAATKLIITIIKAIRGKESFGLPVGGAAARLLAELALRDADKWLFDEGVSFTRFVDDYRVFLKDETEVYDTLAALAEILLAEGLTLNAAKTRVVPIDKYVQDLSEGTADLFSASQEAAIEILTASLYTDEPPDDEEIAALQGLNLASLLEDVLGEDEPDFGKIRKILRAIRVAAPESAVKAIVENFEELLPNAKEVVLILEEVSKGDHAPELEGLKTMFLKSYGESPARNIAIIRGWLVEAFVRGIFPLEAGDLKVLNATSTSLDLRQNYLLQGRLDRRTFFRNKKYQFDTISAAERFSFLIGATCLPKDELKPFLDGIKNTFADPLAPLFCKWLLEKHGGLLN